MFFRGNLPAFFFFCSQTLTGVFSTTCVSALNMLAAVSNLYCITLKARTHRPILAEGEGARRGQVKGEGDGGDLHI